MMKFQIGGDIVLNKTKKYLLPCLQAYGKDFAFRFKHIWKVAVGIGDTVTIKSNIEFEKHIFLLIDTTANRTSFNQFLNWVKEQEMYEDDYVFDNITDGILHMIVIKFPEQHYSALDAFKKSEFSKMYSIDEVNQYFAATSESRQVLIKDHDYKFKFTEQVGSLFNVNLSISEITDDMELDFPVKKEEEIFNTHL